MSSLPFVSCVMPTKNRRAFVPAAIDCWLKQTYVNSELVIVDEGEDPVEDLIPDDKRIRYVFQKVRRNTTGKKRNFCNELARGEIIGHFDDDAREYVIMTPHTPWPWASSTSRRVL